MSQKPEIEENFRTKFICFVMVPLAVAVVLLVLVLAVVVRGGVQARDIEETQ